MFFGLSLTVLAAPAHAQVSIEAESVKATVVVEKLSNIPMNHDFAVLQNALNALESVLSRLAGFLDSLETAELTEGMSVAFKAMDAALSGVSANLIDMRGALAKMGGSSANLGAALPGMEFAAEEASGSGKSFLASMNFVTVAIPSVIAVLGVLILTLIFFGRKDSEEQTATK